MKRYIKSEGFTESETPVFGKPVSESDKKAIRDLFDSRRINILGESDYSNKTELYEPPLEEYWVEVSDIDLEGNHVEGIDWDYLEYDLDSLTLSHGLTYDLDPGTADYGRTYIFYYVAEKQ